MKQDYDCSFKGNQCSSIIPNGVDVCVDSCDCKVRADVTVERVKNVMIWGYVTDCLNKPVSNALVRLMKYQRGCNSNLQDICHTYTDCNGYYQFDLEQNCEGRYRVVVTQCTRYNNCNTEKSCMDTCEPINCPPASCKQYCDPVPSCRSTSRNNIQYY